MLEIEILAARTSEDLAVVYPAPNKADMKLMLFLESSYTGAEALSEVLVFNFEQKNGDPSSIVTMQEGALPRSALSLVARDQPIPARILEAGKLAARNYSISESGTTDYIEETGSKEPSSDQTEIVPPTKNDSTDNQDSTEPSSDNTTSTDAKAQDNQSGEQTNQTSEGGDKPNSDTTNEKATEE